MCREYGMGPTRYIRLCSTRTGYRGWRLLVGMAKIPGGCVPMDVIRSGKYRLLRPIYVRDTHAPKGFGK